MSVVGFDLGSQNSRIAVIRSGGVEVICNEVSERATPTMVSFDAKRRYAGDSSRTQHVGNFRNTVVNLTRLIGRIPEEELSIREKAFQTCELTAKEGILAAGVQYKNDLCAFTSTELMGFFLNKLKSLANAETKAPVKDVVVSVPSYFGEKERRALMDAAEVAGLNCLRTVNDVTAAAVCYGMTKTDIPTDKWRYIAIVDLGYSSLKASIVAVQKGAVEILAHVHDPYLGGRDFDQVLVEHFARHYSNTRKVDLTANKKVLLRLRIACERMKKVLSGIQMTRMELEALLDGMDFPLEITRAELEQLSSSLLDRIQFHLEELVKKSSISLESIEAVEIIGGSTRIPAVKTRISQVFGKEVSTTLNADEAVSRGCALVCAIDSPLVRVREFIIHDISSYSISLTLSDGTFIAECKQVARLGEPSLVTILASAMPQLTFPVAIEAHYSSPAQLLPGTPTQLARFTLTHPKSLDLSTIKKLVLKVIVNTSGCIEIMEATAETETNESLSKEGESQEDASVAQRVISREWPLTIKTESFRIPRSALGALKEAEINMTIQDKLVAETDDARNTVEEYIFEARQKLDDALSTFIPPERKEVIRSKLEQEEAWLYEEGMDLRKEDYQKKLVELRNLISPFEEKLKKELQETLDAVTETNDSISAADEVSSKSASVKEKLGDVDIPSIDMD